LLEAAGAAAGLMASAFCAAFVSFAVGSTVVCAVLNVATAITAAATHVKKTLREATVQTFDTLPEMNTRDFMSRLLAKLIRDLWNE
jgi:hypothetical protein